LIFVNVLDNELLCRNVVCFSLAILKARSTDRKVHLLAVYDYDFGAFSDWSVTSR